MSYDVNTAHNYYLAEQEAQAREEKMTWLRGYACAVAMLIRKNGTVTTEAKELFREGMSWSDLKVIDQEDAALFQEHRDELKG